MKQLNNILKSSIIKGTFCAVLGLYLIIRVDWPIMGFISIIAALDNFTD